MLKDIEKILCATADKLRAKVDAAQYKHIVLGHDDNILVKPNDDNLRKYKYPPDMADDAVQLVLQQAEALGEEWVC